MTALLVIGTLERRRLLRRALRDAEGLPAGWRLMPVVTTTSAQRAQKLRTRRQHLHEAVIRVNSGTSNGLHGPFNSLEQRRSIGLRRARRALALRGPMGGRTVVARPLCRRRPVHEGSIWGRQEWKAEVCCC